MSNEIGCTSDKLKFLAQPTNSAGKLNLYKALSKEVDITCVKCAKPLHLDVEEKLVRCPFCSDFFKPQAKIIFLLGEELQRLSVRPSVNFFLTNKWIKILILLTLFIGFIFSEDLISIGFLTIIFGVLIYELYTRTNHEVKRFRYLTKLLGELESSYQKI